MSLLVLCPGSSQHPCRKGGAGQTGLAAILQTRVATTAALLKAMLLTMQGTCITLGREAAALLIDKMDVAVDAASFLPFCEASHICAGEGAAGLAGLVATTVETSYMVNLGKQGIAQVGSTPYTCALHVTQKHAAQTTENHPKQNRNGLVSSAGARHDLPAQA